MLEQREEKSASEERRIAKDRAEVTKREMQIEKRKAISLSRKVKLKN